MTTSRRFQRAVPALLAVTLLSASAFAGELLYRMPLNGMNTSTAGHLAVNPASKNFGQVVVGGSAGVPVVLQNDGFNALTLNGLSTSAPFSQSNNCPTSLLPGASCAVSVTFTPTGAGAASGALSIGSSEGALQVPLTGQGLTATTNFSLSQASLDFSTSDVGAPAAHQSITVTNTGNSAASVAGIGITDGGSDFAQSNDCGATLAAGRSCTVNLSFMPTAYGPRTGNLVIYDATSGTLYNEALLGFGNAPVMSVSTGALTYSDTVVGYPSSLKATLSNTGNRTVQGLATNISGATADFTISTSTCTTSLAAGASCDVTVSFSPATSGSRSSVLTLGSANADARAIALSGKGFTPVLQLTAAPAAASFGATVVGASADQAVTLTNTGNVAVNVSALSVVAGTADFAQSNNCATISAGGSCRIDLRFAPSARGARAGTVFVRYDTQEMSFSLTGQGLQGVASLAPATLDFGDVRVGQAATSKAITVTNAGDASLRVDSVSATAGSDYTASSNCSTLAAGATCTVTVGFTPTTLGAQSGNLTLASNAGITTAAVTGTGVKGQATASVTALSFAAQQVSVTSSVKSVTVTNTGTSPLVVSAVGLVSGGTDFSQSNNCASVAVGASCNIDVAFTPTVAGNRTGVLALTHDGDGVTTVDLAGDARAASVSLAPPMFASQQVGVTNTADATLTNTGVGPVTVTTPTAAAVAGSSFAFGGATTCVSPLAAGASCTVSVAFNPVAAGPQSGTLSIATSAGNQTAALAGAGMQGAVSASASSLTYAAQQVASTSAAQVVTITNSGTSTLTFSGVGIAAGASDFAQSNTCASVAVNASCTVTVTFTPSAGGARTGTLALTHNGLGLTTVDLAGTGMAQSALLVISAFNPAAVGSSSVASATLRNTGIDVLTLTKPSAASVSGPEFSFLTTTCNTTLPANNTCGVWVRYTPVTSGTSSGTLSLDTGAGVQSLALSATGIQGYASISPGSLAYATQQTGTTSAAQVVTVKNTGTSTLTFSGVGIAAGQSDFAQTNTCSSVAVGDTCTVTVTFTPAAAGTRTGTLGFTHNGGGMAVVDLSGTGQAPTAVVTNSGWGNAQVGDTKLGYQTLTNTGLGPVSLSGTPSVNAPFSYSGTDCPASIAPGASCRLNLSFTPTAVQNYNQTLNVPTSAGTLTSASTATGVAGSLVVTTSGNLGTNLTPQTLSGWHQTYQNAGIGPVTITGAPTVTGTGVSVYVGTGAPYCFNGLVMAPGDTCLVWTGITQNAGTYSGTESLPSSVGTTSVAVSGTVVGGFSVSTTAFGDVAQGSTADRTVTVTNSALWPSRNMTYAATAPFSIQTNSCGATIPANSSCTMTLRFNASSQTAMNGNYVTVTGNYARIRDPGVEETQVMGSTITANGVASGRGTAATLAFSPVSLSFVNVQVGQTLSQGLSIYNSGNVTATGLTGIAVPGFTITPSGALPCSSTLAPGASCTATATFAPTAAQTYSGNYGTYGTNASVVYMPLTGTGVNPSLAIQSIAGTAAIGSVGVYSDSGRWPVYVNNGAGPVTITAHSVDNGNFWAWQGQSGYCQPGLVLAPGATCQFFIGVMTGTTGELSTTDTVTYRGQGSSVDQTVTQVYTASVRGTSINTMNVAFGTVAQNSWSAGQTLRITNNATADPVRAVAVSISGAQPGNFRVASNGCSAGVPAGGYCDIVVQFNPTWSANGFSAVLNVTAGYPRMDPNETSYIPIPTALSYAITMNGNGAYSQATMTSTASQGFGGGWYGQGYNYLNWTYRNDGNVAMSLASPALAAPLGISYNDCSNVAPGAGCTIQVVNYWNADAINGSQSFVASGATIAPAAAGVSYTVYSAVPRWGSAGLNFGNVYVGQSASQNLTLYNDGDTWYDWTYVPNVQNVPTGFSFNMSACSSVAPNGGSCNVVVTFTPTSANNFGGGSIFELAASRASSTFYTSVSGTGVYAPFYSNGAPSFSSATNRTGTSKTATITWTFINPAGVAQAPTAITGIADSGNMSVTVDTASSTCKVGAGVGSGGSCTVVIWASGNLCSSGSFRASVSTSGGTGVTTVSQAVPYTCG